MTSEHEHPIPAMTDPQGRYWEQPSRTLILVDETHAVMERSAFDRLPEYSATIPTGVYEGKMWKARAGGAWRLCWYGPSATPDSCSVNRREILLV